MRPANRPPATLGVLLLAPTLFLTCGDPPSGVLVVGDWGGAGVRLEVVDAGAELEFDCAIGSWETRPSLAAGTFRVAGTYSPEPGGPIGIDDPPPPVWAASYEGEVEGPRMRLVVEVPSRELRIGPFELARGATGQLRKCL